jgi:hypothetical protein
VAQLDALTTGLAEGGMVIVPWGGALGFGMEGSVGVAGGAAIVAPCDKQGREKIKIVMKVQMTRFFSNRMSPPPDYL